MPTLEEVINFILTTENIEDLPTLGDALNERFATEIGLIAESAEEDVDLGDEADQQGQAQAPAQASVPTDQEKNQTPLPPFSL